MTRKAPRDVVIVGGGVIGCAIARELSRYRLDVLLIEKECEVGFGTSKSNSGIIHAGHHASTDTLKGRLEWAGNQAWDQLQDELGFGFKRVGELLVAQEDSQLGTLEKIKAQGEEKGVPGLEIWEPERLRKEEPSLSHDIVAALHAPTAGVVNPYEACFALIDNARENGVAVAVETTVESVAADNGAIVLGTSRGEFAGRFVINAAGVHADRIAEMAGVGGFGITPRKGEEYLLDKRLKGLVKRIIFPCPTATSKGILVIPTFDGTIMVGPTAHETEDRSDITTTMAGGDEVFASVKRVVPGVSERDCIAEFAGLRAAADGEDFIIGPTELKGFINVAGIQSPGLTAAPAIARMVTDILRDEGLELPSDDGFVPTVTHPIRIASLPLEDQIGLAGRDPRFGHVVCRCEHITEGEVIDSIQRGAQTLDGIKFRTRAGMGRCQGGFCSWRCMELIAQEKDVPLTSVTKRGGGSWIICEREDGGEP